jgi:hypothetical protein
MATSNLPGLSCATTCTATATTGTAIRLTASPSAGAVFVGWGGDCRGTSLTCTLAVSNRPLTISARFTTQPPVRLTITLGTDSEGWMKVTAGGVAATCRPRSGKPVTCSYALPHGAQVVLDPVEFVSTWGSGPCAGTAPEEPCVFIASDDVKLIVNVFRKP